MRSGHRDFVTHSGKRITIQNDSGNGTRYTLEEAVIIRDQLTDAIEFIEQHQPRSKYDILKSELLTSFSTEKEASRDHADHRMSDYLNGVSDAWSEATALLEAIIFLIEGCYV